VLDRNGGDGRICKARNELGFGVFLEKNKTRGVLGLYRRGKHAEIERNSSNFAGFGSEGRISMSEEL
jgi:hypothetical protein